MDNKIKSLDDAVEALADFLDDLDEEYGLDFFRYGHEAYMALEFLYDYRHEQWKPLNFNSDSKNH